MSTSSTPLFKTEISDQLATLVESFNRKVDILPTPLYLCDISGACVAANKACLNLIGCTSEQFLDWEWTKFVHSEDIEQVYTDAQNAITTQSTFNSKYRFINTAGQTIYISTVAQPFLGTTEIIGFIGTITDETQNTLLINQLRERDVFMTAMTEAMHEGVIVIDKNGEVLHSNKAAETILGLTHQQITGNLPLDPTRQVVRENGTPLPDSERPIFVALREGMALNDIIVGITNDQEPTKWISINAAPLRQETTGEIYGAVSTFIDITPRINFQALVDQQMSRLNDIHIELELKQDELQQLNSKLKFQAETDALTLLFNRGAIMARLQGIIENRTTPDYGVILLDIDHFKSINDNNGHIVGDQTLQLLASLLSEYAPNGAAIGRYGGEEFLLVCTECTPESLANLAEEIRAYVDYIPDGPVQFTASFGVAHASTVPNPTDLIKCADLALYESKDNGRNQVTLYTSKE